MQLQNYLHYSGQLTEPTEASRKKVQSATFAWEINYDHVFKTKIRRDGTEGSAQRSAAKANNKNNKVEKNRHSAKLLQFRPGVKHVQSVKGNMQWGPSDDEGDMPDEVHAAQRQH